MRGRRTLPLPDALMGELVRYVVAHEVGHTLGLPHNMKASSLYPFEKLRDPEWLKENGHTPTIMDYSRFNYVVQPEDGVPAADLIPKIGPYDLFAIKWGYQPIPGAASAGRREEDARRVGAPAGPDAVAALLDLEQRRLRSRRADRGGRRRRRDPGDDARPEEPRARQRRCCSRRPSSRASRTTTCSSPTRGCSASGCSR